MIYFNNNNCTIYLYGDIIEPYSIFKIENELDLFFKIKENIKLGDAIKILNYTFTQIEPTSNDEKHQEVIEVCEKYDNLVIKDISGNEPVIIDNMSISVDEFKSSYIDLKISSDKVVIINNENTVNVGLY